MARPWLQRGKNMMNFKTLLAGCVIASGSLIAAGCNVDYVDAPPVISTSPAGSTAYYGPPPATPIPPPGSSAHYGPPPAPMPTPVPVPPPAPVIVPGSSAHYGPPPAPVPAPGSSAHYGPAQTAATVVSPSVTTTLS